MINFLFYIHREVVYLNTCFCLKIPYKLFSSLSSHNINQGGKNVANTPRFCQTGNRQKLRLNGLSIFCL